jgi:ankyrin repeat protein
MTAQEIFSNAKAAALANAACKGDASEIVHLVHSGADVNYRGKGGISPLICVKQRW